MFCNQCEQTAKGIGCTTIGVCGKTEDVAALQDLLTYAVQGLSVVAVEGVETIEEIHLPRRDRLACGALRHESAGKGEEQN